MLLRYGSGLSDDLFAGKVSATAQFFHLFFIFPALACVCPR